MIITVPKITVQDEEFGTVTKPDTDATWWQVIEERETEFVIEILSE